MPQEPSLSLIDDVEIACAVEGKASDGIELSRYARRVYVAEYSSGTGKSRDYTSRCEQELTQQDVAGRLAAAGFAASEDVVRSIESGEREVTDKEFKILAKALRVGVEVLLAP